MLVLLFFLRYGSGYLDTFTWEALSGYLIYVYLSVCMLYFKTRKTALMMENSSIGIEVLYAYAFTLRQLWKDFTLYIISFYYIFLPFSGLVSLCFGFVAESQRASKPKYVNKNNSVFSHTNPVRNLVFIQWKVYYPGNKQKYSQWSWMSTNFFKLTNSSHTEQTVLK